jgi:hypothetical protein
VLNLFLRSWRFFKNIFELGKINEEKTFPDTPAVALPKVLGNTVEKKGIGTASFRLPI